MSIVTGLFLALGAFSTLYALRWAAALYESRSLPKEAPERAAMPGALHVAIGFVTNFFDTLGIGSFATTASIYKLLSLVPDERIPGTMIVGHTLPVVAQAFAFIGVVSVDPVLLISMIVAMVAGGWFGAGIVSRLPRRAIQIAMAAALMSAAAFMAVGMLGLYPAGGDALSLPPGRFAVAAAGSFIFGALGMVGVGTYGPSLILFSLLGLNPRSAFPIMMGSGGFLGVIVCMRFIRTRRYVAPASLGLTLGGIPAVILAVWLVKSLPLDVVRWGVIIVVLYTAVMLIRSAAADRREARATPAAV